MTDPTWKEIQYQVMGQAPEAECVSLLSQVMGSYADSLSPGQIDAIAKWFGKNYEREIIKRDELFVEGTSKVLEVEP